MHMSEKTIQPQDDRLLNERELCERWKFSRGTMRKIRIAGEGPRFMPFGNQARYRMSDVIAFERGGLLTQRELAKRWGVTVRAVQKRDEGGGLAGRIKMAGSVRYRLDDIIELENQQSRTSGRMHNPVTQQ